MISFRGYEDVINRVYEEGQETVFNSWDKCTDDEKIHLLNQLKELDFDFLKALFRERNRVFNEGFSPAEWIRRPSQLEADPDFQTAFRLGEGYLQKGKTAAFVVAGGQGSRLGFYGPKGRFPIGPVSGKSLFAIHAERVLESSRRYGIKIPFLVMTSEANHEETMDFFGEHNNFGLPDNQVHLFKQSMIPSLDEQGKLILKDRCSLFMNPDGHGGSLYALEKSGLISLLEKQGIEIISYFQVDNPLVRIIDPLFVGFHVMKNAEISSKAVTKTEAAERVGVFVRFDSGKIGVREYSDLSQEQSESVNEKGELLYNAANIAIHLFSLKFIKRITSGSDLSLPFHTAEKKIPACINGKIEEIRGLKFEKFVFDALSFSDRNVILETERDKEFAPVKNAEGVDSVSSSRNLMDKLYRDWCSRKGIHVPEEVEVLEISPLVAQYPADLPEDIHVPAKKEVYIG